MTHESMDDPGRQAAPVVVLVFGAPRSGTSCVAGLLHHLGIPMGDVRKAGPLNPRGFFEDEALTKLCNSMVGDALKGGIKRSLHARIVQLEKWLEWRCLDGPVIGGKHPKLLRLVDEVAVAIPNLRAVVVRRGAGVCAQSIHDSWRSRVPAALIATMVVAAVCKCENDLLRHNIPTLKLAYRGVLESPTEAVAALADFCGIQPTAEQRMAAVLSVDSSLNHYPDPKE
jgi:hypothetical protein